MVLSTGFAVIRPRSVESAFLGYMFQAEFLIAEVIARSVGVSYPAINASDLMRLHVAAPSANEQTTIATFLDHETAKIDALVAEQEKLIALLKEKRQAVISHAVTKGLNPDAPMKDSGIEWLGEVPAHWDITRLSYYAAIENGTTPSRDNSDYWLNGDIPWLSSGEVNQYRITAAAEFITQNALDECSLRLLPRGTIVIGMIGQGKTRGLSASLEIEACINQNLAAMVPRSDLQSDYLLYIFQSVYEYLREFGRGGNQVALNCEILSSLKVPLPPIEEQLGICDHLCARLNEFDALSAEAQRAIALLAERRSALISATVTGKIDVREFA
jgi:type I restriction enzyme, S subunit